MSGGYGRGRPWRRAFHAMAPVSGPDRVAPLWETPSNPWKSLPVGEFPAGLQRRDFSNRRQIARTVSRIPNRRPHIVQAPELVPAGRPSR